MHKSTIRLYLTVAMLSFCATNVCADEIIIRERIFVANEDRHQWVNEHNGRTGTLIVRGALLSSPCSLETNEVKMPLPQRKKGMNEQSELKLNLVGCGEGGAVISAESPAGHGSKITGYSALLTGIEGGVFHPDQRMIGKGKAVMHGGENQLTWYLNKTQQHNLETLQVGDYKKAVSYLSPRDSRSLLRLRLDYD
ncbi:Uncharacterised protein [Citrobacter freundii]|nr:Uncharacterised protein [Citrobacter freundii]